eukprot:168915-Chlamydomonas_euryale.AAC.1
MGGAALMMAVAHCVMAAGLQVRLRLMVPTVENAVSGNAYRPLDVLKTRAGGRKKMDLLYLCCRHRVDLPRCRCS